MTPNHSLAAVLNGEAEAGDPHAGGEEDRAAAQYIHASLVQNHQAAQTLYQMRSVIDDFRAHFITMVSRKCSDGRTHGTKGFGIPPGECNLMRVEGNRGDLDDDNLEFWRPLHQACIAAERHTPKAPALLVTESHYSTQSSGCGAHKRTGDTKEHTRERARGCVMEQVKAVRERFTHKELYAIAGEVDTDTMAKTLYFGDGVVLCTKELIRSLGLSKPADIFQSNFLRSQIDDERTDGYVGGLTPEQLLQDNGSDGPPMYQNLQVALAMQAYLLREVSAVTRTENPEKKNHIFEPKILHAIEGILDAVEGFPQEIRRILLYMMIWNTAYALYQEERLASMTDAERILHTEHAETELAYAVGLQTQTRNTSLYLKPGGGHDELSLGVLYGILKANRERNPTNFPPIGRINIELQEPPSAWDTFNALLGQIDTKLHLMRKVMGSDARFITSYSYERGDNAKKFFPVQPRGSDPQLPYPTDLAAGLDKDTFHPLTLHGRETAFSMKLLAEGNGDA